MELRQLRYFVSAATHLNFTKAAKECYIVQSSMTEQMARLENELEVKLFDRQKKGMVLTEAGEFFLHRARAILSEAEKAGEEMKSFRAGYRSLLRIGYMGEMFKEEMIRALREYRQELPQVRVALRQLPEEDLLEGLRDSQFDVILLPWRESFQDETWMETASVMAMGAVLVTAADHPLAQRESIRMEELRGLPYVSFGISGQEETKKRIPSSGPEDPGVEMTLDHTSTEILVASGYRVSLYGTGMTRDSVRPDLRFIPVLEDPFQLETVLAWHRDKLSSQGKRFCQIFQAQFRKER